MFDVNMHGYTQTDYIVYYSNIVTASSEMAQIFA